VFYTFIRPWNTRNDDGTDVNVWWQLVLDVHNERLHSYGGRERKLSSAYRQYVGPSSTKCTVLDEVDEGT